MIRSLAWLAIALGAACNKTHSHDEPSRPSIPIREIRAHAGATAMWGGRELLLSFVRDWERPGPVRVSRGLGPVERTLTGWPLGVSGKFAFALVPKPPGLEVVKVATDGEPVSLGQLPAPAEYATPSGAVAGGVVAAHVGGADVYLLDDSGVKKASVVREGESVVSLAGNPDAPELAAVLRHSHGAPPPGPANRLVLIDARTGAVRWQVGIDSLPANEGEAAFVAGGILVHHDGGFALHDTQTGAARPKWRDAYVDARNMTMSRAGDLIAYTHRVGTGHMALTDPGCQVYVRDDHPQDALVTSFDGDCYFGLGLLLVDAELWLAPP